MQTTIYTTDDNVMYRPVGQYKIRSVGIGGPFYVTIQGKRKVVSWFGLKTWFLTGVTL